MGEILDGYGGIDGFFDAYTDTLWDAHWSTVLANQHVGDMRLTVGDSVDNSYDLARVSQALYDIIDAIRSVYGDELGEVWMDIATDGIQLGYEEGTVDWKGIMRAWWDAPEAGWAWTVQFIDFMRKAVWDKPENIINQESFME